MRRLSTFALGAVALLLTGCADTGGIEHGNSAVIGTNTAMKRLFKQDARHNPVQAARVEALARAGAPAIIAQIESRAAQGALYQVQSRKGVSAYLSADGSLITLDQGFLSATRGLGGDLMSSEHARVIPMVLARREGAVERTFRHLNGDDRLVAERFVCRVENRGAREIPVPGGATAQTTFLAEICLSEGGELRNLYWVGQDGQLVQSRQWAGDWLGMIAILH